VVFKKSFLSALVGLTVCHLTVDALGSDWPMWRYDARRSAASPEELPTELHLQWVREYPPLEPAWPDEPRMRFDAAYQPVVMGKTVFFGSSLNDSVTALDTESGAEKWRFYADGPVRFAPVAWKGKVYFVSDDGYLYCLDAATGALIWRFRGGPSERKVLGNGRLICVWPARGAPVLVGGTVYFAAGIWPFEGIFIYALDAETGKIVWLNDGSGALYIRQPHNSPAFAGVAPQGYLAAIGDRLLIPNGRAVPACFDRATGSLLYFHLAANGKRGDSHVCAIRDFFFNDGTMFELARGTARMGVGPEPVLAEEAIYASDGAELRAYDVRNAGFAAVRGRKGTKPKRRAMDQLWKVKARGKVHIKAGRRLYIGRKNILEAIDIPTGGQEPWFSRRTRIVGTPSTMLAADGKLFVVTLEGHIYCFGAERTQARMPEAREEVLVPRGAVWRYVDDGADPGTAWREARFDHSGWKSGRAQLGYGDGDEATVTRGRRRFITTYFRRAFRVRVRRRYEMLSLSLLADDGAVVYLNGKEVFRVRMPEGPIDHLTLASEGAREGVFNQTQLDPSLLVRGVNVVAAEVHQTSIRSSDVSFELELTATKPSRRTRRARARAPVDEWTREAGNILKQTGATEGYCLMLGLGTGRLAEELARQSKLQVIGVDPDPKKVDAVRRRLDAAGLYGSRVAVHAGDPLSFRFPPYIARLIVSEDLRAGGCDSGKRFAERIFRSLRPYGGVACLSIPEHKREAFARWVSAAGLPNAEVSRRGEFTLLTRPGALPGSGDWTHQYADSANTCVSKDRRVRAPLGLLWFGGSSNKKILPRHGHGPSEQVVGGRLFIEGPDIIRALDVYTGRVLWEAWLPGVGEVYNRTYHQPGANAVGSNYVSAHDGIYVGYGASCLRLDPATGKKIGEFKLFVDPGVDAGPAWGYLGLWKDILVAAVSPETYFADAHFSARDFRGRKYMDRMVEWVRKLKDFELIEKEKGQSDAQFVVSNLNKLLDDEAFIRKLPPDQNALERFERMTKIVRAFAGQPATKAGYDAELTELKRRLLEEYNPLIPRRRFDIGSPGVWSGTSSKLLMAINRYTGRLLWQRWAANSFLHNAIAIGGGKVFCIDRLPEGVLKAMRRRGRSPRRASQLLALDARTGAVLWSTYNDVFGTWLGYSHKRGVLLQASRASPDMLPEPGKRMRAVRGKDGMLLWDEPHRYSGPCMLHGDTIITQGHAFSLLTGEARTRKHPLTGQEARWRFRRNYGCNTAIASQHLLTFRSAAAGYFDLANDGGTGNLGGFRSGCTSNLVVANGVLNAPDYTRTCICTYHNQTSLALVHVPEVETWTFSAFRRSERPVRRVGINFGAPGDRLADNGTLWLDYPSVGGPSPDVPLEIAPEKPEWFRHHSSWIQGDGLKWVAASGVKGLSSVTVSLTKRPRRKAPEGAGDPTRSKGRVFRRRPAPRPYTIRLHFVEPDDARPGERLFTVTLQGREVLADLDVVQEAGGPRRPLVKEFKGVEIRGDLTIAFTPSAATGRSAPVICGIEIVAEGR